MSEIGEILRGAREQKGLTVAEVSEATRIKDTFLDALEQGDYSALPGPAYVTGFLRNYASYLGLHPDDVVQEFYTRRPMPQPVVKPATRVLANGHNRHNRVRLFWTLGAIILVFAAAYAIKQYNDTYAAHPYAAPLNVTAATLGSGTIKAHTQHRQTQPVRLQLRAVSRVWVRVTVDGRRAFQGFLRPARGPHMWTGHNTIYVVTYDGALVRAIYNGKPMGAMASRTGLVVSLATSAGWRPIS